MKSTQLLLIVTAGVTPASSTPAWMYSFTPRRHHRIADAGQHRDACPSRAALVTICHVLERASELEDPDGDQQQKRQRQRHFHQRNAPVVSSQAASSVVSC
jgi:hypothetical protein